MKLLFKQRLFSWFDSYDIYDEAGNTVYVVKGQLSWGHKLVIYDAYGNEVGMVVQKVLTFLPKFEIYKNGSYIGCLSKEFSFLTPHYNIDYNGWHIDGTIMEWDYSILDRSGYLIARFRKCVGCADVCTGNRCRKMFQKLIVDLVTVIIRRMKHGNIQKENREKNI